MINRQGPRAGAERFSDFWFGFLVAGQRLMTMVLESVAMTPRGRSSLLTQTPLGPLPDCPSAWVRGLRF